MFAEVQVLLYKEQINRIDFIKNQIHINSFNLNVTSTKARLNYILPLRYATYLLFNLECATKDKHF